MLALSLFGAGGGAAGVILGNGGAAAGPGCGMGAVFVILIGDFTVFVHARSLDDHIAVWFK